MAECRDCQEPMIWTTTTNGKKMPVNAEPVSWYEGCKLFHIEPAEGRGMNSIFMDKAGPGMTGYEAHWATCQFSDNFRSKPPEPVAAPSSGAGQYAGLYGKAPKPATDTGQGDLFNLGNPPKETPGTMIPALRELCGTWIDSSKAKEKHSADFVGVIGSKMYGEATAERDCAQQLDNLIKRHLGQ